MPNSPAPAARSRANRPGAARPLPDRILRRIRARGRGSVHVPVDFLDLGTRAAVDSALRRLTDAGHLRRIGRGLYDLPRIHARFGPRPPAVDDVARAVARSHGEDICHAPAHAAHALGLTTQVPTRAEYLTDGTSRTLHVDLGSGQGFDIRFRTSRYRHGGDTPAGLTLRALQFLGPKALTPATAARLTRTLTPRDRRELTTLLPHARGWTRPLLRQVLAGEENASVA